MDAESATVQSRTEQLIRVRCPADRSLRPSNAACSRRSAPLFVPRHAREGIGSAQARRRHHGRIAHRSVADRVAPTSPRRCAWRIPSQCAKPPSPSCHLRPSSFVDPAEQFSSINFSCSEPSSSSVLTQSGTGTVRTWPPLPTRSTMAQCSSRLLEVIQSQRHGFMPSQAAREQQC